MAGTEHGIELSAGDSFAGYRIEQRLGRGGMGVLYLALEPGLERRVARAEPIGAIASVASFFVSRVDTKADALLAADSNLRGRVAIANAHRAYGRYSQRFAGERWWALGAAGARPQRPLWASTGTKDPVYSDVLYVEELIAPGVVNTMPEATLRAFADHGEATRLLSESTATADEVLRDAERAGVDLAAVTAHLEREGVESFCASYHELIERIETKTEGGVMAAERPDAVR